MSDRIDLPTPLKASARLAIMFRGGRRPTADDEARARIVLAASRIEKEIRDSLAACPVALDPVHTAHLVGLLLMSVGTDGDSVERCARSIREALYVTPGVTIEDRAAIAQMVLGGDVK